METLEEVIRQFIALPPATAKGWYYVLCKVCNDHGRKGKRAGFRFDGEKTGYNCFNCGHAATYDPDKHDRISKNMKIVLDAFQIPDTEWQMVSLKNMERQGKTSDAPRPVSIEPRELTFPKSFYPLAEAAEDDAWAEIARYHLEDKRCIDPNSYRFMLSGPSQDSQVVKWRGRLIIPIYKGEKLIYWQGRDLTDRALQKYLSPPDERDRVLHGYDEIFRETENPLYILEGWFDAFVIGGVAILGNKILEPQIKWLNRSHRKKVYIPDRLGDGHKAALQALSLGWHISTPNIGDCKDISAGVKKYGKLYVMKSIVEHTAIGFAAETNLGVYCDKGSSKKEDQESR